MSASGSKTNRELILELHQGVYGVPGTNEQGLCGDMRDLVKEVRTQNSRVRIVERRVAWLRGVLIGAGALGGGTGIGLGIKTLIGG